MQSYGGVAGPSDRVVEPSGPALAFWPSSVPAVRLLFVLSVLAPLAAGCASETPSRPEPASGAASIPFAIDGELSFLRDRPDGTVDTLKTIAIEVADTDSTRTRGLMERREIPADTGMLFVFDHAAPQGFWMTNTPHSLDIQFYAADSTLLNIATDAVPYSQETLPSAGPAQFVVEVAAGVSRRIGLVEGDRIAWRLHGATPVPESAGR